MTPQHRKRLFQVLIAIAVVLVLGVVWFIYTTTNTSYVRIVDTSVRTLSGTPSPGADIDAIELQRGEKYWFATEIVSAQIKQGTDGNINKYPIESVATGSPDDDKGADGAVSLGGGELIVQLPKRMKEGDFITIHELGSSTGLNADSFDIYTSKSKDGPWALRSSGSGPTTVEIN